MCRRLRLAVGGSETEKSTINKLCPLTNHVNMSCDKFKPFETLKSTWTDVQLSPNAVTTPSS